MKNAAKRVFSCKIGADTAENEQHFAEKIAKHWQLPYSQKEELGVAERDAHPLVEGDAVQAQELHDLGVRHGGDLG